MTSSPTSNINPDRLSLYVEELRQFSAVYRIPVEQPQSLQMLYDRLIKDESFLLDFESMMRSIVYREKCQVASSDLVGLVGLTWGDPGDPDLTESTQSPARDVAAFVRKAMKLPHLGLAESNDHSECPDMPHDELSDEQPILAARTLPGEQVSAKNENTGSPQIHARKKETPWWAEVRSDDTVFRHLQERQFRAPREPNVDQKTETLATDPWANDSTFHRELLQFEARRKGSN